MDDVVVFLHPGIESAPINKFYTWIIMQFAHEPPTPSLRIKIETFISELKLRCFECNDINKDQATALAYAYDFLDQIHERLNAN
jgi:hypothetical protein